jgi:hypothetical protein
MDCLLTYINAAYVTDSTQRGILEQPEIMPSIQSLSCKQNNQIYVPCPPDECASDNGTSVLACCSFSFTCFLALLHCPGHVPHVPQATSTATFGWRWHPFSYDSFFGRNKVSGVND